MSRPTPATVESAIEAWVGACYADPLRFVETREKLRAAALQNAAARRAKRIA